jgi:Na+-driven multidrug efflux pump
MDRMGTAHKEATAFALAFRLIIATVSTAAARTMGGSFLNDPEVSDILIRYVRITCFGYGLLEVHRCVAFCMTGIQRPLISVSLNALRRLMLLISPSYLGAKVAGSPGTCNNPALPASALSERRGGCHLEDLDCS